MAGLGNRYDIIRKLGSGGMGTVFLVSDRRERGRRLALKRFSKDVKMTAIEREFNTLATLYHPQIVEAYEWGRLEDGAGYFTSAYIEGEEFVRALSRRPLKERLRLLVDLALALDFIHQKKILHLDLKPENVLVEKNRGIKILDFGLSRVLSKDATALSGGTLAYMAPERLKGEKIDGRADLYSLGMMTYQVFLGKLPFSIKNPDRIVEFHLKGELVLQGQAKIPDVVKKMISLCLAKRPEDRFSRGLDLAKFIRDEGGIEVDLSDYGPLSGAYRKALKGDVTTFLSQLEVNLKKERGPIPPSVWEEKLRQLGRYEEVLSHIKVVSDEEIAMIGKMRALHGRVLLEKGDYLKILELPRVTPEDFNNHGLAEYYLGHLAKAESLFKTALRKSREPLLQGSSWNYLGMTAYVAGKPGEAKAAYEKAEACFVKHGESQPLVSVWMNRGALAQSLGDWTEALRFYEKSLTAARKIDHSFLVATLLNNLANLYIQFGAKAEAKAFIAESKRIAESEEMPLIVGYNLLIEGDLALLEEKFSKADQLFEKGGVHFESLGMKREMAIARANLFESAVLRGDLKKAESHADGEMETVRLALLRGEKSALKKTEKEPRSLEMLLARVIGLEAVGERDQAAVAIKRAEGEWRKFRDSVPFEYREGLREHPRFKGFFNKMRAYEEEDPVKLANFKKILEVNQKMSSERRLDKLLEFIMDAVIEISKAERGFLILSRDKRKREELHIDVARNIDRETIQKPAYKVSRTLVKKVLETGKALLTSDASADPRLKSAKSIQSLHLKSILCVPLVYHGHVLGAIYLENRFQQGVFTEDDREVFSVFADQAAMAVQNARLHEENVEHIAKITELNERLNRVVAKQEVEIDSVSARLAKSERILSRNTHYEGIVGESAAMGKVFDLLDRLADREISVLVTGESGTGKELIGKALHINGPRKAGEFVAINCSAIPAHLLESELFGHMRGAFTGADRDKAGLFEVANGGTLFLDEIGDMPIEMQAKLLRVIQEREIRRLGNHRKIPIDVRLISATHRDLARYVKEGKFREDLYYRLNAVEIHLPALRERREDIPLLIQVFLKKWAKDRDIAVSAGALNALMAYDWPGNVRELQNEIERAVTLSPAEIDESILSPKICLSSDGNPQASSSSMRETRGQYERGLVLRTLKEVSGNKTLAARKLGISRVTLYQKLKLLSVDG